MVNPQRFKGIVKIFEWIVSSLVSSLQSIVQFQLVQKLIGLILRGTFIHFCAVLM